jgi:hypothetical protein
MSSSSSKPNVVTRSAAVQARLDMTNGNFNLPDETLAAMKEIRAACSEAQAKVVESVEKVKFDTGRLIHTLDLLQQVKNCACDSVILPHAPSAPK